MGCNLSVLSSRRHRQQQSSHSPSSEKPSSSSDSPEMASGAPDANAFTAPFMLTKSMQRDVYPAVNPSTNPALSAKGKVVIVTGAAGGLGYAIAKSFDAAGAKAIVLVGRRLEPLQQTAKDLRNAATLPITGDVSSLSDAEAIVKKTVSQFGGRVDVLVNAAGPMNVGPTGVIDPNSWWENFEGGVRGKFNMTHALLQANGDNGPPATVINLVSLGASFLMPGMSGYSSAMLATIKLGECLDVEHGGGEGASGKLRVFSVHPGMVEAEGGRGMVVESLLPFSKDKPALTGGLATYLATSQADFLKGGYLHANWDVEELEKHKAEVVEKKLVKLAFLNAQLQPGGYAWSS